MISPQRLAEATASLNSLRAQGDLGEATFQCAVDILNLCSPEQCGEGEALMGWTLFSELDEDSLRAWRAEDLHNWKQRLSPSDWHQRFGVGPELPFTSVDDLLSCTDWSYLVHRLIPSLAPQSAPRRPPRG